MKECYVDGQPNAGCVSTGTKVVKGTSQPFTLGGTISSGSHVLKFVSNDDAVFVFTIVGGQPSIIAPTIQAVRRYL